MDLPTSNSTVQEFLTGTQEEERRLMEENRTSKGAMELPIVGSTTGRREGRLQPRCHVIGTRGSYSETSEAGLHKGESAKQKRMERYGVGCRKKEKQTDKIWERESDGPRNLRNFAADEISRHDP